MRIIVTSGGKYSDIDVYGGCSAYAELLRLQGKDAIAVINQNLNNSVTTVLRTLPIQVAYHYVPKQEDKFVLIDISEEEFFSPFVVHENIVEIIDHHPGFEAYWATQKHVSAQIEAVGAACTQVFERWQDASLTNALSPELATLLMAGILDNTLGMRAHITTTRDHSAYEKLQQISGDDGTFRERYFEDCQHEIEAGLRSALVNDLKTPTFPGLGLTATGQLTVWDGAEILDQHFSEICSVMDSHTEWILNLICIQDSKSVFIVRGDAIQVYLSNLLAIQFDERGVAISDRLWLRKEIMKAAIATHGEIA